MKPNKINNRKQNKQNLVEGRCQNANGYYDSSIPYDKHYIDAKIEVFLKYREKQTPLRVLDAIATDKQLQEQKNLILLHCKRSNFSQIPRQYQKPHCSIKKDTKNIAFSSLRSITKNQLPILGDKRVSILWKSYLQKRQIAFKSKVKSKGGILASRINTEGLSSRKRSYSSQILQREVYSRQTNILKISDDEHFPTRK